MGRNCGIKSIDTSAKSGYFFHNRAWILEKLMDYFCRRWGITSLENRWILLPQIGHNLFMNLFWSFACHKWGGFCRNSFCKVYREGRATNGAGSVEIHSGQSTAKGVPQMGLVLEKFILHSLPPRACHKWGETSVKFILLTLRAIKVDTSHIETNSSHCRKRGVSQVKIDRNLFCLVCVPWKRPQVHATIGV